MGTNEFQVIADEHSLSSQQVVIAYVEDHPRVVMLLRLARRRAQERNCRWRAVFIETPEQAIQTDDAPKRRRLRLSTLAEQMGGEVTHMEAASTEKGIEQLLEKEKALLALVLIGSVEVEGGMSRFRNPSWVRLAKIAGQYTKVEIVPLTGQLYHRSMKDRLHWRALRPLDAIYALLAVGIAYLCSLFLQGLFSPALFRINDQNVALLFMIACAFVAGRYGLMPGLLASVASFLTVNYFFTPPYEVLKINTITDVLNMALFLSAALLISLFTSQARNYARNAAEREQNTQALFMLYRLASEEHSRQEALSTLQQRLEKMLEVKVAFFLPSILNPAQVEPAYPANPELQEADKKALHMCWSEMKTTGVGSPSQLGSTWRFEPMISSTGEEGVLGIKPYGKTKLDTWLGRLFTAIADQTAAVLQHIGMERSMEETRMREEREKLRSMLLSSVSHDFKTPLAGIVGALSVYRNLGERLTQQKRDELIETAIDEAQRLDNFITNILDMTRLETGNITFKKEWHNIEDILEKVIQRMQLRCRQHHLVIMPSPIAIEARMDLLMTSQAIQNVIDNACKYTAAGTQIEISCRVDESVGCLCEIRDFGPGIPTEKAHLIFDKYTRLHKKDSQVAGTGLGLAIARAIMEAQNGRVTAANHPQGGAIFTLCLPEWRVQSAQVKHQPKEIDHVAFAQTYSGHR